MLMDINQLRKEEHLSASGVSDYRDCSLLYRFGRVDKLPIEFTNDALVLGTAVHEVLAEFYQEILIGRKMTAKELTVLFTKSWKKLAYKRKDIQYSEGKDYDTILLTGKELMLTYYTSLLEEEYTILSIEEPFSFYVEGVPVPIIGVYDLVIEDSAGVVTIIDHKTTSRAYSVDEVQKNFQLSVYHLGAKRTDFSDREIYLRFDCLIKTKKPKFEQYYSIRSEEDDIRTVRVIREVWNGISKGVFIPNTSSWKCNYCLYRDACDEWFRKSEEENINMEEILNGKAQ